MGEGEQDSRFEAPISNEIESEMSRSINHALVIPACFRGLHEDEGQSISWAYLRPST